MGAFDWTKVQGGGGWGGGPVTMRPSMTTPPAAPDAEAIRKANLAQQAGAAGAFAGQGEAGYGQLTAEAQAQRDYLRDLASGKNSISAEQLRQGLQQNLAGQQSMAAGAAPRNAAMAARTAAIQSGRLGAGLAGQQAIAGLKERQDAQAALSQMILGQRGQDVQVALGSRGNALNGYGAGLTGAPPVAPPSLFDKILGAASGALPLLTMARGKPATPAAPNPYDPTGPNTLVPPVINPYTYPSDRRLKTDVAGADGAAKKTLEGLRAYAYKYKDEANGKGRQLGVMAQDLEKAGLGQVVVNTPGGKVVHGARLAGANTALLAALAKRVGKLEGGR